MVFGVGPSGPGVQSRGAQSRPMRGPPPGRWGVWGRIPQGRTCLAGGGVVGCGRGGVGDLRGVGGVWGGGGGGGGLEGWAGEPLVSTRESQSSTSFGF